GGGRGEQRRNGQVLMALDVRARAIAPDVADAHATARADVQHDGRLARGARGDKGLAHGPVVHARVQQGLEVVKRLAAPTLYGFMTWHVGHRQGSLVDALFPAQQTIRAAPALPNGGLQSASRCRTLPGVTAFTIPPEAPTMKRRSFLKAAAAGTALAAA